MSKDKNNVNREYKDRLFRMIFSEKKYALELYNALNNTSYEDEGELEITSLKDAIYMSMRNDVSFLIRDFMNLYEHQSTKNPNMPFRGFLYFADLYKRWSKDINFFTTKLIKIPTPRYIVMYNGDEDMEEEEYLKLSDAFEHYEEKPQLEVVARVINVNAGHSHSLMNRCQILREYSVFVDLVRRFYKSMSLEDAAEEAIDECITKGVLTEFLIKRRSDVMGSILTEYDEKKTMDSIKEEGREEGREEGQRFILVEIINKKWKKNQSADQIAEAIEEESSFVEEVISLLKQGLSVEEITNQLINKTLSK